MNDDPMASEDDPTMFPDDDLDDTNSSSSTLNAAIPDPDSTSSYSDTDPSLHHHHHTSTVVTVAVSSSISPAPTPVSSFNPVTVALPHRVDAAPSPTTVPDRKPIDDSRRLFQRLWTDEDEIELLQGFLDYTTSRGTTSSGHHHDTAAFYDQIKSKLQLDFNKNQLVEKLRRLKKKYRNVLSKMASGKEFVFKSPHDQATFELSKKIWSNLSGSFRGGGSGVGSGGGGGMSSSIVEFDDDEPPNSNPNPNYNAVTVAAATPPRPLNSSYVISHINLNASGGGGGGYDMMMTNKSGIGGGLPKLSTRKRPRAAGGKVEDRFVKAEGINVNDHMNNNNMNSMNHDVTVNPSSGGNYVNNVTVGSPLQGLVEETVRNCLSPVLKELINTAVNGAAASVAGGNGLAGFKGVGALALNAMPLSFSGVNAGGSKGEGMDEKWRKQQILELEVYSKRLELVQDQIKLSLEELRSMELE